MGAVGGSASIWPGELFVAQNQHPDARLVYSAIFRRHSRKMNKILHFSRAPDVFF